MWKGPGDRSVDQESDPLKGEIKEGWIQAFWTAVQHSLREVLEPKSPSEESWCFDIPAKLSHWPRQTMGSMTSAQLQQLQNTAAKAVASRDPARCRSQRYILRAATRSLTMAGAAGFRK